ncbi:MAG TPA: serine hydrolase domain-containing protein [Kofleriaceae bacterium]|nr:serine hydrolase domain-containing protein [Kofleriaceae bacterium]
MQALAGLADEMFARGIGSGAAISVGDAGREVARLCTGVTRRLPTAGGLVDERTWFDVASLSKPMATVACAMVLAGDGALDLDAPIRRWLPAAASTGSVRQLLGHAAGCAAHVEFFRRLAVGDHPDPRAELVEMASTEPANLPGVSAVYSDLGYLMLGAIIERAAGAPLEDAFRTLVAEPLGLAARYPGTTALPGSVATELDERTGAPAVVEGRVHDENAYFGGGICGHAGLFARIGDVATFAAAIIDTAHGTPRGRLRTDVVTRFLTDSAASGASWRLGWDTPSTTPGVSHAGDRWPRTGSVGHLGFTGTSLWLDLPRRRWVALLTNRVHPTRHGPSAEAIKALRRAVNDTACELLDARR